MNEPRQRELRGPSSASDRIFCLEHDHTETGGGKLDRRGEPVGPRSDNDRVVAQSCLVARKGFATKRKGAPVM